MAQKADCRPGQVRLRVRPGAGCRAYWWNERALRLPRASRTATARPRIVMYGSAREAVFADPSARGGRSGESRMRMPSLR